MSKHDYHDPHHGLRETYHDLEVEKMERLYRETWLCATCGKRSPLSASVCQHCEMPKDH